ncbi:MAG TPA: hypothetical protein VL443_24445 [Cyclobacteriaceae bacterium]|jgi:hypothetical protein|nr:hypothetical protein [Cyclobacteriaceae bacterium]
MKFVDNLVNALHNKPEGFSARKLASFTGVCVSVFITIKYTDDKVLVSVLTVWLLFALLCLGIITFQQIMDFKSGRTTTTTSNMKVETTDTKTEQKNT